jgi:6-phosphofructokinase
VPQGWLTAAATLGRREGKDDGPHLVYLPEADFDPDEFIASVDACMKRLGRCLVAVSEGIHDAKGELFLAAYAKKAGSNLAGMKDSHGNVSLGGTGVLGDALAGMVKEKLGGRVRADTFGFLQRGFPADTSTVSTTHLAQFLGMCRPRCTELHAGILGAGGFARG